MNPLHVFLISFTYITWSYIKETQTKQKINRKIRWLWGLSVMSVYDYKCYQFWKVETSVYIKHVFIWHIQDQLYLSKFSESCMQKQLFIHKMDISEKKKSFQYLSFYSLTIIETEGVFFIWK